jgi:SAM-dependent methyltransferase
MTTEPPQDLGAGLAAPEYLRRRNKPSLADVDFLILTDLIRLVERFAAQVEGVLFDYGCGGAPYRNHFTRCRQYICADVTPGVHVQRLLRADGLTEEPANAYDVVFSSQVLEHVLKPEAYVRECHRILKPGGHLIISTHGMFEEHGCPYDFHRWTSRGLEELVTDSGFTVLESLKVTTELRAAIQMAHYLVLHLQWRDRPLVHYPLAVVRKLYGWIAVPVLNLLGKALTRHSMVAATNPASLYLGVAVLARKTELTLPSR